MNILHPPSYSPVPGPGIPRLSNGRLAPSLFLFLSVLHTNTGLLPFLSLCSYFRAAISFLPYLPHIFLHFLFAGVSFFILALFPFLPPIYTPPPRPLQQPSTISPSAAPSFICMAECKGCRQCEQGQQSPPVSIQARAEICNARQRSPMQG